MDNFNIQLKENNTDNFICTSYSHLLYSENLKQINHSHSFVEIFYVVSGKGALVGENKPYPIKTGDLIIVNPNFIHTEISDKNSPLEYVYLGVKNLSFSDSNNALKDKNLFIFELVEIKDEVKKLSDSIEEEYTNKNVFWGIKINAICNELACLFFRSTNLSILPYNTVVAPSIAHKVQLYISSHFYDNITLDKLSSLFAVSKFHLSRTFKKTFNKTIIECINETRCKDAKNLLETSDMSITEIATLTGFNNVTHFTETYKKFINETPLSTRKKQNYLWNT